MTEVLKVWSKDFFGSLRPFQAAPEVKIIFISISITSSIRCYLSFHFHSLKSIQWLSRVSTTGDAVVFLVANAMCCVFLCLKISQFQFLIQ